MLCSSDNSRADLPVAQVLRARMKLVQDGHGSILQQPILVPSYRGTVQRLRGSFRAGTGHLRTATHLPPPPRNAP